jgi:hypothetical protein
VKTLSAKINTIDGENEARNKSFLRMPAWMIPLTILKYPNCLSVWSIIAPMYFPMGLTTWTETGAVVFPFTKGLPYVYAQHARCHDHDHDEVGAKQTKGHTMQHPTMMKGASALAALSALLFTASSVASYVENVTIARFPVLMAVAWFIIAGLLYQRARQTKHKPTVRSVIARQHTLERKHKGRKY